MKQICHGHAKHRFYPTMFLRMLLLIVACYASLFPAKTVNGGENLIKNGSFEATAEQCDAVFSDTCPSDWTYEGDNWGHVTAPTTPGEGWAATDGTRAIAFNTGNRQPNGKFAQSFATTIGQEYRLTFNAGVRNFFSPSEQKIRVKVQGITPHVMEEIALDDEALDAFGFQSFRSSYTLQTFIFTADSANTTLTFEDISPNSDNIDLLLDNVSVVKRTLPPIVPATLLQVNPANRRYFMNAEGKPVFLTGRHSFGTLQDCELVPPSSARPPLDYLAYLDAMRNTNHNFLRMWNIEGMPLKDITHNDTNDGRVTPIPFARTTTSGAADGGNKFDLTQFSVGNPTNPDINSPHFFERLRARVIAAGDRGIYVSIMLFEGVWVNGPLALNWIYSLHNPANNVNGYLMIPSQTYTMATPAWVGLMDDYVKKVIDTVNDLDNVLYEVMNEAPSATEGFQYHIIDQIKSYEAGKPKQHMVGMTSYDATGTTDNGINAALLNSNADWISLAKREGNRTIVADAPATPTTKVSIYDTDHVWGWPIAHNTFGEPGNTWFVWQSLVHGHNPIYLDDKFPPNPHPPEQSVLDAMGYARALANRIDLNNMVPMGDSTSTGHALINPGVEYLVYQPPSFSLSPSLTSITVQNLPAKSGVLLEWINPATGIAALERVDTTQGPNEFFPPAGFTNGAVLHLRFIVPTAVSRKTHGVQDFDVPLPLTGEPGIECRRMQNAPNDHKIVVTFSDPVTQPNATITNGTGSVVSTTANGPEVTVDLTGVTNEQTVTVTLTGATNGNNFNIDVPMGMLFGDVNSSRVVTGADVNLAKAEMLSPLTNDNFRCDINVSGVIAGADANLIKAKALISLP